MKKLFFATLIAASVSTGALAQNFNHIDERAVENFETSFAGASDVNWVSKQNFTKASFTQNNRLVEVFYNTTGDFIAITTQIEMDKLPTFVKRIFAKGYSDYIVRQAFKFEADEETAYYISAQNEKESVVLKSNRGLFSVYSRTAKG